MKNLVILLLLFVGINVNTFAQGGIWNPSKKCELDANGNCAPTSIRTVMPFLRVSPDARGGGLGDAGIASKPSAASIYYNASNLAFVKDKAGVIYNFTHWPTSLGINKINLYNISGYRKIDSNNIIGIDLKFLYADPLIFERGLDGREHLLGIYYIKKISKNISASLSAKYLNSNMPVIFAGKFPSSVKIIVSDFSLTYKVMENNRNNFSLGICVSNLGPKVRYETPAVPEHIPTNLGIGSKYGIKFHNQEISFVLDANKLLVPSPHSFSNPDWDSKPKNNIADWTEKSAISGVFSSFADAQGGLKEELKEIYFSTGIEYTILEKYTIRGGYNYDSPLKGNKSYFTFGTGMKYKRMEFNISYLPSSKIQNTPVDRTLKVGMGINFM
jgi:hypothetical protein